MSGMHITPGYNGWTHNAKSVLKAIERKEREKVIAERADESNADRARAEADYYNDNNCFPRPTGYFGTETDAHFNER